MLALHRTAARSSSRAPLGPERWTSARVRGSIAILAVLLTADAAWNTRAADAADAKRAAAASSLFGDELLVGGQGIEVRRSQLDEAFVTYRANLAARGQRLPETERARIEAQLLDRLVLTQLLLTKATDDERAKGGETADRVIKDLQERARSEDAFKRQVFAMGLSPERFRAQLFEQAVCEHVLDRELRPKAVISDDAVRKAYDENPSRFEEPERVRAAHVLISTREPITQAAFSEAQIKEKRAVADKVLARARAGDEFAKLAKEFSEDPGSKDSGGEYTFPRGQMVREFEAAAFSMNPGQISDIVTTQFGFHIIKLYEKLPPKRLPFDTVAAQIKEQLQLVEINEKHLPEYAQRLRTEAKVELIAGKPPAEAPAEAPGDKAKP
jgi:peptidyl-prolyl cis-trans isomerase C